MYFKDEFNNSIDSASIKFQEYNSLAPWKRIVSEPYYNI